MRTKKNPPSRPPQEASTRGGEERLQKILARAGIASRRECEALILAGRVEVDRQVVTELGTRADPRTAEIRVDGVSVKLRRPVYYAVHKPPGVVSTNRDPAGRARVVDLVPEQERVFTVGRLDKSSEGLILVTNDGELANLLTHPRYGVPKVYEVQVAGEVDSEVPNRLRQGIHLAEGLARVESARIKSRHKQSTILEMVLHEGRNRVVRRLLARVGHKVLRLKRIAVGAVRLGRLPPGDFRPLNSREITALRQAVDGGKPRKGRAKSAAGKTATASRKSPSQPHKTKRAVPRRPPRGAKSSQRGSGRRKGR